MSSRTGNRLTDNAFTADDGRKLIEQAILDIGTQFGWRPVDQSVLFYGVYYDSTKVGSFITRVTNERGEFAVLKIQLRPLPFDEGFIMRHVQSQIKTDRVRLPRIISDAPWNEKRGYGYLILEDLSQLPHLWATRPDEAAFVSGAWHHGARHRIRMPPQLAVCFPHSFKRIVHDFQ
ncbi:type IV toxin-antitoxin system AbiEi family antitoxin [Patescibacteria group bacterium]|nr:type IV toxin-antitoxin system AbiEi family antitoxin [Patescibacteria group bacterium]MBU1908274.1 type IV toxin-antitoxin system AbiEi family antitoxin [Patescibacteria group bacterium]